MRFNRICPMCMVAVGEPHKIDCHIEQCSVCGGQRIKCNCEGHDPVAAAWNGNWPAEEEELERISRKEGLRWHPELQQRESAGTLSKEEERHLMIHSLADSLLPYNQALSSLVNSAEERGVDGHEIRHILAASFLSTMWDYHHNKPQFDKWGVEARFQAALRAM